MISACDFESIENQVTEYAFEQATASRKIRCTRLGTAQKAVGRIRRRSNSHRHQPSRLWPTPDLQFPAVTKGTGTGVAPLRPVATSLEAA